MGVLALQTDRSVGTLKCYLSGPKGVKRELWFAKLYKSPRGGRIRPPESWSDE